MNKGFYDRIFNWHFPNVPDDWNPTRVDELFEERTETSSDVEKYPLFSLTIENGVTPKTDRYERSFLLKDKAENQYKVVYPKDFVFNPMNLRFGAISYSQQEKIVTVSAYYNILRPIREQYSPLIEAIFKSHAMMNVYDVIAIGSLIEKRRVHWSVLKDVLIPLPPLAEQKAIAQILGTWDEAIATTEALIEALQSRKRALMQRLLTGEVRFPGFDEEWDTVKLGDVAKSNRHSFTGGPFGSNLKASDYTDDGVRIIQLQNIGDGEFIDDNKIYTSYEKADELISCNIYPDDIIMSKMGDPVARATFIPDIEKRYVMASDGIRLEVDDNRFDPRYVLEYINSRYFRNTAIRHSTGSTRQRIGLTDLRKLPVQVPSEKVEQEKIADVLTLENYYIDDLQQHITHLQEQKRGLMQVLLTGQVRVGV